MSRDQWPPGGRDGEGRATPDPANVEELSLNNPTPQTHRKHTHRRCAPKPGGDRWRRPASDIYCDAFRRGAIDALRLAGREIDDPDVWVVLDRLADYYRGAADRWAS
jgi:hypothetical protein